MYGSHNRIAMAVGFIKDKNLSDQQKDFFIQSCGWTQSIKELSDIKKHYEKHFEKFEIENYRLENSFR